MDYRALSERFTSETFPAATIAVVGGSTASGTRTATSDIDLLLIGDGLLADGQSSLAATYTFQSEVFEVFAYTLDGFKQWAERGLAQYRPVIVYMLLQGAAIRGDGALAELRDRWREIIAAGPNVPQHELDMRRYAVTDLLDDLRDATDAVERYVIASALFEKLAELMLLSEHRWIGTGKYLPRQLRDLSPDRTDALTQPLLNSDYSAFADRAEHELDTAGGRVQAGSVR